MKSDELKERARRYYNNRIGQNSLISTVQLMIEFAELEVYIHEEKKNKMVIQKFTVEEIYNYIQYAALHYGNTNIRTKLTAKNIIKANL